MKKEVVSYISSTSTYEGKIIFSGILRVDGIFNGCIEKDSINESILIVGKCGRVNAKANIDRLSVEGSIEGDFNVSQKSEFTIGSKFKGKLFTPILVVQQGAVIEGSINMGSGKAKGCEGPKGDEKAKELEQVTGIEYGFGEKTLHERS
jgi:cytoskeletal protein CcmA (bactofilin family)